MEQPRSVSVQHGSTGGDSKSRHDDSSFLRKSRMSDWEYEGPIIQTWLNDQALPGVGNSLEESAVIRGTARASAVLKMFDDAFDRSWESETRNMGKATKHNPHTVETSPAEREKLAILPKPSGLEAKIDGTVGSSTFDPSIIVSESKGTWKSTQDGQSATGPSQDYRRLFVPTLNIFQEDMIKKIMKRFWARFDDWLPMTTGCAGKSTTSQTTSSGYEGQGVSSTWTVSSNQARNSGSSSKGGSRGEKPYDRPTKKPRKSGGTCKDRDRTLDFACPFKKRHPREYNLDEHRACTIGHWPSIALMKQHLTRRHKPLIQCRRCWNCFQSQEALDRHSMRSTLCQILEHNPGPEMTAGMTVEMESWLKTEKRPGQSEVDRWKAIYERLFPGSPIPSPYFDLLIDFHDFERVEVPRIFEESIRALIAEEMLPLEERIVERMGELVRSSQERALSAYRAVYVMETEPELRQDTIIPTPQSLLHTYSNNSAPGVESASSRFLGNGDLLMCGCHGLCTCMGIPYEPAMLAQPTFAQGSVPVGTSGNSIDGNNTEIKTLHEPGFTSPMSDGEEETFEWSNWMND